MQMMHVHSAGQEIRLATTQFARARAREKKAEPRGLLIDQHLNEIQESRDSLHFVDEHGANRGRCCA
jgi:hypothetical protein